MRSIGLPQSTAVPTTVLIFRSLPSDLRAGQRADGQLIELQAWRRYALLQDASDASASVLVD